MNHKFCQINALGGLILAVALIACSSDSSETIINPPTQSLETSSQSNGNIEPTSSAPSTDKHSSSSFIQSLSSEYGTDLIISSSSSFPDAETESSSSTPTAISSEQASEQPISSSSDIIITSSETSNKKSSSSISPYFWNDEFEGTSIDSTKWSFETGATGWGNNEWQYYTARPENAYIQDGILHIRANKESYEGASYTSARLITKGKFSFTYGTIEARIALPLGKGIWPAFWMLGDNIDDVSWPACGEIDIIEAVNEENVVYGTNHWAYEGQHADYGNKTSDYYGTSIALDIKEFHTYRLTWNEKAITMYVDDFKYHEISIENSAGGTDAFHKPFFLLLNIAVAGNWPGFEVDDTQFPNEMLVDYIRVTR